MNEPTPTSIVKSPCIRQCQLNDEELCLGCYRTLKEIVNWSAATAEQQMNILSAAQQRQQNLSD